MHHAKIVKKLPCARLTQPDKIAIVFTQESESQEYYEYIEFLQAKGFLKREAEEFEIEELQGVKGLKALRVSVELGNTNQAESADKIIKSWVVS